MKIGYARVSTIDQDLRLQKDALQAAGCDRVFEETASSAKADRPQLLRALDTMRAGDTLIVWKLDRLARSIQQLIETVQKLDGQGVQLRSLTEQIETATPGGRLTFHIFSALAEFERSLIRERTLAGLQAAKARGKVGGRPKSLNAEAVTMAKTLLANPDYTHEFIAKKLGVSRSTLFRALKETPKPALALSTLEDFATAINALAKGLAKRILSERIAISQAYDEGLAQNLSLGTLQVFKTRLAEAGREGLVSLERCDVAGAMEPMHEDRSKMVLGRDVRHFIVADFRRD